MAQSRIVREEVARPEVSSLQHSHQFEELRGAELLPFIRAKWHYWLLLGNVARERVEEHDQPEDQIEGRAPP